MSLDFEVRGPAGIAMPVDEISAEDDRLLARLRFTGRHTGTFPGTPATGRRVDIAVMDDFRAAEGRLAEHWALMGNLSLLRRIGAADA